MTSKLTREERVQALYDMKVGQVLSLDDIENVKMLSRMALAAMESEPVFTLQVSQADYKGQKLGNHFGFITLDAARELKEGNYQLYRYAQPAPVVPDDVLDALQKVARIRLELNDFDGDRRGIAFCLSEAEEALIEVVNRRAAMLQAGNHTEQLLDMADHSGDATKKAGNSPVIPDGSASMLRRWLAFGRGMQNAGSQLPHNLIAETEAMLAAAPQSPGSEPATVPGKWIPVNKQREWPEPKDGEPRLHIKSQPALQEVHDEK